MAEDLSHEDKMKVNLSYIYRYMCM